MSVCTERARRGPWWVGSCLLLAVAAWATDTEVKEIQWAQPAPLAPESLLIDAQIVDGRIVAVGERGHVLVSTDGGRTWTQARVPTRVMLTAVHFVDEKQGWAVGHDVTILHTSDGGLTWEMQYRDREEQAPLLDVRFEDPKSGLAVGAYSLALETSDGGKTWSPRRIDDEEPQPHLNAIVEGPDGTLYMAAEFGLVFRSDDGGETWKRFETPYEGSYFDAMVVDAQTLLVFGLRGHVFRSEDRGESWQEIETGTTASLMGAIREPDGDIVIGGLSGTVLVSSDEGRSFRLIEREDRSAISVILGLGEDTLLVGENGVQRVDPSFELSAGRRHE